MAIRQEQAVLRDQLGPGDETKFWRDPRLNDLECLRATFRNHVYARHVHETYSIGVIEAGHEGYHHRGQSWIASGGQFALLNPDESHDGYPVGEGYRYRTLYPEPTLMRWVMAEVMDRDSADLPWFPAGPIKDPDLFVRLRRMHARLESDPSPLGRDESFLETFALLIARHSDSSPGIPKQGREAGAVARAVDYVMANLSEPVALEDLAEHCGLGRYRLIRCFRREVGMTPHAFLMTKRVAMARRLLAGGEGLVETALLCGFSDQSHLNRVFKSQVGITPGRYRAATGSRAFH